jgi:hypothetical protein
MSAILDANAKVGEFADVRPIAERLVRVLGPRAVARLIGTDHANLINYISERRTISVDVARRLIDTEFLLSRVAQVFVGRAAVDWLLSADVRRGGARRIDIFAADGVAPLLDDLERIAEGAYA